MSGPNETGQGKDEQGTIVSTQRERPMKSRSFVVILSFCLCAPQAITTVYAQVPTAGGADKIKAMLLRPTGWKADWSLPYDKGVSEIIFEARGDKVVAKTRNLTYPTTCERDVTITSDTVKFDGCYDTDITLRFDPDDQAYPFKGTSRKGYDWKVQPK